MRVTRSAKKSSPPSTERSDAESRRESTTSLGRGGGRAGTTGVAPPSPSRRAREGMYNSPSDEERADSNFCAPPARPDRSKVTTFFIGISKGGRGRKQAVEYTPEPEPAVHYRSSVSEAGVDSAARGTSTVVSLSAAAPLSNRSSFSEWPVDWKTERRGHDGNSAP